MKTQTSNEHNQGIQPTPVKIVTKHIEKIIGHMLLLGIETICGINH